MPSIALSFQRIANYSNYERSRSPMFAWQPPRDEYHHSKTRQQGSSISHCHRSRLPAVRRMSPSIERGDMARRNCDDSAPTAVATYNPLRDVREPCALNKAGQSHDRVRIGTRDSLTKVEAKTESGSGLMRVLSMELGFRAPCEAINTMPLCLESTSNSNTLESLREGDFSDRKLCGAE